MASLGPEQPLHLSAASMRVARFDIETEFAQIDSSFVVTSSKSFEYNCVAWALGLDKGNWWPSEDDYWPPELPKILSIEAFESAFTILGFEKCAQRGVEKNCIKIALYVKDGFPRHVARQLPSGRWSSKLGTEYDIAHHSLQDLMGKRYGNVYSCYRKRV